MGIKTCQRIWGVIQPNLGRGTLASGTAFADRHRGRVFRIQKNICAELSQITWRRRHRSKGHHADIWRRPGAKHCSSLCSQSEGGRILWRPNTAKNPTTSCAKALVIFATCLWPSLCEQSELQCWRRNRRLCGTKLRITGPAQISAARA